jgi:hypothetical protein
LAFIGNYKRERKRDLQGEAEKNENGEHQDDGENR